jgi:uroporphyrinogen-III synthase
VVDNLLNGFGIAVTRPVDQAQRLCLAIEQQGGTAILFPLIAIAPLEDYREFEQTIANLDSASWAIFISTNAVDNAMPRLINKFGKMPENLKFAAIGHQTAKQLGLHGVHGVLVPQTRFDSESLLALPEMHDVSGQAIMIFRGVGGREILADTLKARGAQIIFAESYRRVNPQADCAELDRLWSKQQLQAIVVTSSEAMRHILKMTHNGNDAWIRNIHICVNHARIAEDADALGLQVHIANTPSDEAMLACLQQALLTNNE